MPLLVWAGTGKLRIAFNNNLLEFFDWVELGVFLILPMVEWVIACGLVLSPRYFALPAYLLFVSFIGYLAGIWFHGVEQCNCLGNGQTLLTSSALSLDFLALAALLSSSQLRPFASGRLATFLLLAMVPLSLGVGLLFHKPISDMSLGSAPSALRTTVKFQPLVGATISYPTKVSVINRSKKEIHVSRLVPSCHCTKLSPSTFKLGAGSSEEIQVEIDLTKSFLPGESRKWQKLTATAYSPDGESLGDVALFSGVVFRHFELETRQKSIEWIDTPDPKPIEIPLTMFHKSGGVYHFESTGLKLVDVDSNRLRIFVQPRKTSYDKTKFMLSFTDSNGLSSSVEREIAITRQSPTSNILCRLDDGTFEIEARENESVVTAFAQSVEGDRGPELSAALSQDGSSCFNVTPEVMPLGTDHFVDVKFENSGFSHSAIVPLLDISLALKVASTVNRGTCDYLDQFITIEFFGEAIFPRHSQTAMMMPELGWMPDETTAVPVHLMLTADTLNKRVWFVATKSLWQGDLGGIASAAVLTTYMDESMLTQEGYGNVVRRRPTESFVMSADDRSVMALPLRIETSRDVEALIYSMQLAVDGESRQDNDYASLFPDETMQRFVFGKDGTVLNTIAYGTVGTAATLGDSMEDGGRPLITWVFRQDRVFSGYRGVLYCHRGIPTTVPSVPIPTETENIGTVTSTEKRRGSLHSFSMSIAPWFGVFAFFVSACFLIRSTDDVFAK